MNLAAIELLGFASGTLELGVQLSAGFSKPTLCCANMESGSEIHDF